MFINPFLECTEVIDWKEEGVFKKAWELAGTLRDDTEIARNCFEWVRDNISHSGDTGKWAVTLSV